ncbi:MAG: YggT family protein [Dehalococcoidia bacterium]|nr:YggT family protein [Dehalococcoidia bacterium]MYD27627.1 YggT family protein [Dehalococcoidia bacterium]
MPGAHRGVRTRRLRALARVGSGPVNPVIADLFRAFLYILIAAIVARALLSWFPISRTNPLIRIVHQITDPLIDPVRRAMPRTGMIDLSPMIVIIVLWLMIWVVNRVSN